MEFFFAIRAVIKEILKETKDICIPLFKILVPMVIFIKILKMTGLVTILGKILEPLMVLTGVPGEMGGLAWASALATNLYGGVIVFVSLAADVDMTVAQATVLASIMLMAHGFPVELQISKQAGTRIRAMLLFRFGSALLFGIFLNVFYKAFNILQEPVSILYTPPKVRDDSLFSWAYSEVTNLVYIAIIIMCLVALMKLFKKIGFINLINMACKPMLKIMGGIASRRHM